MSNTILISKLPAEIASLLSTMGFWENLNRKVANMKLFKFMTFLVVLIISLQSTLLNADTEKKIGKTGKTVPELIERFNIIKWETAERNFVIEDLILSKDPRVFNAFVDAMFNHTSVHTRRVAASALGRLGGAKAIPILKTALNDPQCAEIKYNVADSLWKLGDKEEVFPILEEFARDGYLPAILQYDENKTWILRDNKFKSVIIESLQNNDLKIRALASDVLYNMGELDLIIPVEIHIFKNSKDWKDRYKALSVLDKIMDKKQNKDAENSIKDALNDENPEIRKYSDKIIKKKNIK